MLVIDWRIFVDFLFFRYFRLTGLLIKISPILFHFLSLPTRFFFFFYSYQLTFAFDRHAFTSEHAHTFKYMQAYSHPLIQLHIPQQISTHTHIIVGMFPSAQHIEACLQCQQLLHESNSHLLYIEATQSPVSMLIALKV